jgi:hypothetical protein
LLIHVQVVISKTRRLFLPNRPANATVYRHVYAESLRNQWILERLPGHGMCHDSP